MDEYMCAVEYVKKGDYVRRVSKNGINKKVYKRGDYNRVTKKYSLIDCDDIYGNGFEVRAGTVLNVGFTY